MMETTVFGKWILAGEHAVIRGGPALAFPVLSRALSLRYEDGGDELTVEFGGEHGSEMQLLFWGVIERALAMKNQARSSVRGKFWISSSVPVGAGLGASATLCVAIGRWMQWKNLVSVEELQEFCRELENLFHGESSGLDIAVALSGRGLHFERRGERYAVDPSWEPDWYISYSGKRGVTSECVTRVKALWETDRPRAERIDQEMHAAVIEAEEALTHDDASEGFTRLAHAIDRAGECFSQWGLADGQIGSHMQMLREHGAHAVKPTGSGDGGYVLSLWKSPPPDLFKSVLIRLGR